MKAQSIEENCYYIFLDLLFTCIENEEFYSVEEALKALEIDVNIIDQLSKTNKITARLFAFSKAACSENVLHAFEKKKISSQNFTKYVIANDHGQLFLKNSFDCVET
jgi:hypothetical protein